MKISAALSGVSRLFIETTPFIYFVLRNPTYLDRVRSILTYVDAGTIQGFSSTVTLTEVLMQPFKANDRQIEAAYRAILTNSKQFTLIPIDTIVAERAAQLRASYNLKTPDALQVAASLHVGCDTFLTNDFGLKRLKEIRVLILDELELDTLPTESN